MEGQHADIAIVCTEAGFLTQRVSVEEMHRAVAAAEGDELAVGRDGDGLDVEAVRGGRQDLAGRAIASAG